MNDKCYICRCELDSFDYVVWRIDNREERTCIVCDNFLRETKLVLSRKIEKEGKEILGINGYYSGGANNYHEIFLKEWCYVVEELHNGNYEILYIVYV